MTKRKADDVNWETQPCPLCSAETLPKDDKLEWIACEACRNWYHASCLDLSPQTLAAYFCASCTEQGRGSTQLRDERPKRAKVGIDYTALDSGQHVNSLRHAYTAFIESRTFGKSHAKELNGMDLTKAYLNEHGFAAPIVVHSQEGLEMSIPVDLSVDKVAQLVGEDTSIEVMDVPTQGEDKGWTLGRWAAYYNEPNPARVRNVISLEVSDTKLGEMIVRPRIVRDLDVVDQYWPQWYHAKGKTPKVQTYCLMSLQNSYTDFHVDFAGTSVYYHILQGAKTFLFIPPSAANLNKYSDWCKSSDQSTRFLADECKDTFKVELHKGDTMFIPSGWIHAVHTPTKSLVIGGNFLHLYGMQKHLEVADIEELTKVPGKFRFPYFNKTLWFTAIGILIQREVPNKHQILGVYKMAQYLYQKAISLRDKPGRKPTDDVPMDHMRCSPLLVAKLLIGYVKHYVADYGMLLPDVRDEYSLSQDELDACPVTLKGPIALSRTSSIPEDIWCTIPIDPREGVVQGEQIMETAKAAVFVESTRNTSKPAVPMPDTPNIYAKENSYLPPLQAFGPPPGPSPQYKQGPILMPFDGGKLATTCFRCKTRKRKCDKARPCDSCKEAGLADTCIDIGSSGQFTMPAPTTSPLPMSLDRIVEATYSEALPVSQKVPHSNGVSAKSIKQSEAKQSRQKSKISVRCGRCARDKKQCNRESPICDRCIKKGLTPADCIYPGPTKVPDRPDTMSMNALAPSKHDEGILEDHGNGMAGSLSNTPGSVTPLEDEFAAQTRPLDLESTASVLQPPMAAIE